jgi:hypothetical protein
MAPVDDSVQSINRSSSKKNVSVDAHEAPNSISNAHNAGSIPNNIGVRKTTRTTRKTMYAFFF